MIVTAYNPPVDNLEKSFLSYSYASAQTTIVVRNNDRFAVNDRIMLGEMGNETTEIVTVSAVNADGITLTIGATKFPHTASDPVYQMRYDQVKFYRSVAGVDGSYDIAATVGMDVDNMDKQTRYNDPTGLSTYYYKVSYYNTQSAVESSMSNAIPGQGYDPNQVGTLAKEFLTEIGDLQQEYITIPQILTLLNECSEDIIGQSKKPYRFLRKKSTATITAGSDRIPLPATLIRLDRVSYNRVDGVSNTTGDVALISMEEMEYKQFDQNSLPLAIGVGVAVGAIDETSNELVLYPKPTTTQTNKITFFYWSNFNYLTSLSDTFQTPVKRIYKLFLLGRYYRMRSKKDQGFLSLSDRYLSDYNTEVVKLQRANRLDVGTPMSFLPDTGTARGLRR